MSIKTNTFIVGAQKCGTTTLAKYLDEHSKVELCDRKEPHIFSSHYPGKEKIDNACLALYKYSDREVYIDASTTYSFGKDSSVVAQRILEYNSKAKIIFLVKDPIERIISHYSHRVRRGRKVNQIDLELLSNPIYVENSQYYQCIVPYVKAFGRENVLILQFDDLVKNLEIVSNTIKGFLNLHEDLSLELPNENRNLTQGLATIRYGILKKYVLKYFPERVQAYVRNRFFTKKITKKAQPSVETVKLLRLQLADDLEQFYNLTGFDYR